MRDDENLAARCRIGNSLATGACLRSWLPYRTPNLRARLRLFCFPYAGGGASIFRGWADHLPPEVELCAVQLPGRENRARESPFFQLSLLVQTAARVLLPCLDMPFAFFGHSMGALISFELARLLAREKGLGPVQLFVSGYRAPHLPDPDPPFHRLGDGAFLAEIRRLNGTHPSVLENREIMDMLLPVLRADFAVCETYVYSSEDPLNCPITAFGGTQDGDVSTSDLEAWQEHTRGSFTLRMLPGSHFFLHDAQPRLLQVIGHDLARPTASRKTSK